MQPSPMHYFPLTLLFMALLGLVLVLVIALIEVGVVTYAYQEMGLDRRYVFTFLFLSLLGSYINIPIAERPARTVPDEGVVAYVPFLRNMFHFSILRHFAALGWPTWLSPRWHDRLRLSILTYSRPTAK